MNLSANELLRRLSPITRFESAASAGAGARPQVELFETQGFDELLTLAIDGSLRSERPISVTAEVQPPLSNEQMMSLAIAADRAEASGIGRALMLLDGRAFEVDVAARAVESEMRPDDGEAIRRVEAAMVVLSGDQGADARASGSQFAVLERFNAARLALVSKPANPPQRHAPKSR